MRRLPGLAILLAPLLAACGGESAAPRELLRVGTMHEAIGNGEDRGRIRLDTLEARQHLYGVGALAGLDGEITLLDSRAVVTRVAEDGSLRPAGTTDAQATLFLGQVVPAWTGHRVEEAVPPEAVDDAVATAAGEAATGDPFVFLVEGSFRDVRLHVIHGACPIHARRSGIELPADESPYEGEWDRLEGTLVGVFAENAAGEITHPGTRIHAHLVFRDPETGVHVTGHIEQVGLAAGATIRIPHRAPGSR